MQLAMPIGDLIQRRQKCTILNRFAHIDYVDRHIEIKSNNKVKRFVNDKLRTELTEDRMANFYMRNTMRQRLDGMIYFLKNIM